MKEPKFNCKNARIVGKRYRFEDKKSRNLCIVFLFSAVEFFF